MGTERKTVRVVAAIIRDGDKIFATQRGHGELKGGWEFPGGKIEPGETPEEALAREVWEELGLRLPKDRFRKLAVYGEPGRIAAYQDGSIWRMVIVVFALELPENSTLRISEESRELRWFSRDELADISIVVTHSDIVDDWFTNAP